MRTAKTFPAIPDSARRARNLVMATFIEAGCTPNCVEVARVLASELATNAVVHAEAESFELAVEVDEPNVRVTVTDADPTPPEVRPSGGAREGGHGLLLVDHLADRWGVDPLDGGQGKAVWFELRCA